jgi:hypothetical protein
VSFYKQISHNAVFTTAKTITLLLARYFSLSRSSPFIDSIDWAEEIIDLEVIVVVSG